MGLLEHFQKSFPIPKVCFRESCVNAKQTFGIGKQYRDSPSRRLKSRCDLGEFARIRHLRRAEPPQCPGAASKARRTTPAPRRSAPRHHGTQHGAGAARQRSGAAHCRTGVSGRQATCRIPTGQIHRPAHGARRSRSPASCTRAREPHACPPSSHAHASASTSSSNAMNSS